MCRRTADSVLRTANDDDIATRYGISAAVARSRTAGSRTHFENRTIAMMHRMKYGTNAAAPAYSFAIR